MLVKHDDDPCRITATRSYIKPGFRVGSRNPNSVPQISDTRSYGPEIHRIMFGQASKKVGSDIGRIEFIIKIPGCAVSCQVNVTGIYSITTQTTDIPSLSLIQP